VFFFFFQFEEYVSAALASVRYRDFVAKGEASGVLITGGTGMSFTHAIIRERVQKCTFLS
jgi:molybdopterin biosynthesis enzyme MoaB